MKEKVSRNHIENTKSDSFKYGYNDCALWSFRYVKALNGLDLFTKYVGKYTTWSGGRSALRKFGDNTLINYVNQNFKSIHLSFAQRGDLIMFRGALGICQGKFTFFLNKKGVTHILTNDCSLSWRVDEKCPK